MRYAKLFLFLFAGLLMLWLPVVGQDGPPPAEPNQGNARENRRPNLLAELGLAPEQVQQIRRMNQERRPRMMAARQRMGEAARNLDAAIYGDALVSDAEFQTRLKEFHAAEAELARLRFENELAVRKVLTPEQLVKFRDLRRRFAERARERFPNRRFQRRGQGGPPPAREVLPKKPLN